MSQVSGHWTERVADSIKANVPNPQLIANLDDVLRWVTEKPGEPSDRLDAAFRDRRMNLEVARKRSLKIIAKMLFRTTANPWHVLGLRETATKKEIRDRSKRLTQVFHPDKQLGDEEWLNSCVDTIRRAYDATQLPVHQHTRPIVTPEKRPMFEEDETAVQRRPPARPQPRMTPKRARSILGSASSVKRRVMFAVTAVCAGYAGLVVFAMISEQRSGQAARTISTTEVANANIVTPLVVEAPSAPVAPVKKKIVAEVVEPRTTPVLQPKPAQRSPIVETDPGMAIAPETETVPLPAVTESAVPVPDQGAAAVASLAAPSLPVVTSRVDESKRPAQTTVNPVEPELQNPVASLDSGPDQALAEATPDLAANSPAPIVPDSSVRTVEIKQFLGEYTEHYVLGDAKSLVRLYDTNASEGGRRGRADIEKMYARLFNVSDRRYLSITIGNVYEEQGSVVADGSMQRSVRQKDGSLINDEFAVRFRFKQKGKQLRIVSLSY